MDSPESVDLTLITHFLNHHAVIPKFMTYIFYIIGTGGALFHSLYGIQKALSVCFKTKPFSLFAASSFKNILIGCLVISALTVFSVGGMFETIDSSQFDTWTDLELKLLSIPSQILLGRH